MLGIVFNMSANLITGRYYRKIIMQRVNDDLVQPKFLRLKYQPMLMSLRVDSFMPVVLTNPSQPVLKHSS